MFGRGGELIGLVAQEAEIFQENTTGSRRSALTRAKHTSPTDDSHENDKLFHHHNGLKDIQCTSTK